MSRATLYVRFPDGSLRYGLYDGTSDFAWAQLYATPSEAWDAYGSEPYDFDDGDGEPVDVATDYGAGFSWRGTATRDFLTSGYEPYENDSYESGEPSWARYPS